MSTSTLPADCWTVSSGIATWVMVVITAVYCVVTYLLLREATSNRVQQREPVVVAYVHVFGKDGTFNILVKNEGSRPVFDLEAQQSMPLSRFLAEHCQSLPDYPTTCKKRVLLPGSQIIIGGYSWKSGVQQGTTDGFDVKIRCRGAGCALQEFRSPIDPAQNDADESASCFRDGLQEVSPLDPLPQVMARR